VICCAAATYYALWKARQQRLLAVNSKFVNSTQYRMVPDSTRAPTAAILSHVTDETESETDYFRPQERREPEPEGNSTDEDDAWASATASPTGYFPVTSFTDEGTPLTSFLDGNYHHARLADEAGESPVMTSFDVINNSPNSSIDVSRWTENSERTARETPVTSLIENGDSVTSFEVQTDPPEPTDNFRPIECDADVECRLMTSRADTGNTARNDGGCFSDTELAAGSSDCLAAESPLTSSDNDVNPVTSYPDESTESRYPQTGSDVTKLVLQRDNRSVVLHRVQMPTVGKLLAEVAEHVTIESLPTTDQSLARLYDSMRDLGIPRDHVVNIDTTQSSLCHNAELNGQTEGVLDSTDRQRTTPQLETNSTASEDKDIPKRGRLCETAKQAFDKLGYSTA